MSKNCGNHSTMARADQKRVHVHVVVGAAIALIHQSRLRRLMSSVSSARSACSATRSLIFACRNIPHRPELTSGVPTPFIVVHHSLCDVHERFGGVPA